MMKRTVAIALSTLGIAGFACASEPVAIPQPSFIDYVTISERDVSPRSASALRSGDARLPTPSFVDYATLDAEQASASAGAGSSPAMLADVSESSMQRFPGPSFND